tara:strand:- start:4401 stop:5648 length:1248 start_codon:yes stop_codon:yes gene_type:complete
MMKRSLKLVVAPIISLVIVTMANGLFTTLLTLRLNENGVPAIFIGLVSGAYYAGMVIGSFQCERFISRVGHIRAFAVMASASAAIFLAQGLCNDVWVNMFLRFCGGICMAGIFIVIESWLLARSTQRTRGQILAVYMTALYAAQATAQFLLQLHTTEQLLLFCICAMLASLSVIPVAMTYIRSPVIKEPSTLSFKKLYRISPIGVVGCFAGGLMLGAIYSLMPLFFAQLHYAVGDIAILMSVLIYGGMLLQYPVGRLSDFIGRRRVLIAITMLTGAMCFLMIGFAQINMATLVLLVFLLGGFAFTLYPMAISYACDYIPKADIVGATQGLLLAYGVGATIGPIVAPLFIHVTGTYGLPLFCIVVSVVTSIFFLWRSTQRKAIPVEEQQEYVTLPRTSPIANELDPRAEEAEEELL